MEGQHRSGKLRTVSLDNLCNCHVVVIVGSSSNFLPQIIRSLSEGEVPKQKKRLCAFCKGHSHTARACEATRSLRHSGGSNSPTTKPRREPTTVLSQLHHDLGANAGSLLSIDEDEECVVQVVALFAPAPAPDVLDPATLCKVITFTTNDVAAPHRTGITCWGRLMGWCNHFKSTRHFLFAKCA